MARTDEAKWKRIVSSVKAGTSGGKAGQWSARKAQLDIEQMKEKIRTLFELWNSRNK